MSEEIKVGNLILSEDDLEFTVTYNGELFTMRHPTPFEKAAIEADIARRLGGMPRASYPTDHLAMVEATAYVDQLVIRDPKSPAWFKSAWTCYDDRCVNELYTGYLRFRGKFQERLKEGRSEGSRKGGGT